MRQRTMLINALRANLAELGVVAAKGLSGVGGLSGKVDELSTSDARPDTLTQPLRGLSTNAARSRRRSSAWTPKSTRALALVKGVADLRASLASLASLASAPSPPARSA